MKSRRTLWARDRAGTAGALVSIFFLLALADAMVALHREPADYFMCVAGASLSVMGPLPQKMSDTAQVSYEVNSPYLSLVVDSVHTSFWSGAPVWQGRVLVGAEVPPGEYRIMILPRDRTDEKSAITIRVGVFKDGSAARKASVSYVRRYLGISPWWAVSFTFLLVIATFGTVVLLSHHAEGLLAKEGKAEVYRVLKEERGWVIHFDMGLRQGLSAGTSVRLLDGRGSYIGTAVVEDVFDDHSVAWTDLAVRQGMIVQIPLPEMRRANAVP